MWVIRWNWYRCFLFYLNLKFHRIGSLFLELFHWDRIFSLKLIQIIRFVTWFISQNSKALSSNFVSPFSSFSFNSCAISNGSLRALNIPKFKWLQRFFYAYSQICFDIGRDFESILELFWGDILLIFHHRDQLLCQFSLCFQCLSVH